VVNSVVTSSFVPPSRARSESDYSPPLPAVGRATSQSEGERAPAEQAARIVTNREHRARRKRAMLLASAVPHRAAVPATGTPYDNQQEAAEIHGATGAMC